MKILVCGGRKFGANKEEYYHILNVLNDLAKKYSKEYKPEENWLPIDITIISGMAKGADSVAANWAIANWAQLEEYPADWDKYGMSAGYKRNMQMLVEGKPDLVVAFPGGKGTANMIKLAEKANIEVLKPLML